MAKNEFNCEGMDELINYFNQYANSDNFQRASKKALKEGAEVVAQSIKNSLETTKDKGYSKGYTVEDITVGTPRKTSTGFVCKIGWNGEHSRYRLVHLNEFGYSKGGKTYYPPMLGKVQKGVTDAKDEYVDVVKKTIDEEME